MKFITKAFGQSQVMPPLHFTKIGVPTPLEHLLNIINSKKMGRNSLPKYKILRDFNDNSNAQN